MLVAGFQHETNTSAPSRATYESSVCGKEVEFEQADDAVTRAIEIARTAKRSDKCG
jgi:hypothetical protein